MKARKDAMTILMQLNGTALENIKLENTYFYEL